MSVVLVTIATLVGWNAVFILTAERGVLPWIALLAAVLSLSAMAVAGPDARARWVSRPGAGVLRGGASAAVLVAASWAGWLVRDIVPVDVTTEVEGLYAVLRRPPGPVLGLPLMVITILGEEIIFRGLLQDAVRKRLGSRVAVVLPAVLYALANVGSGTWILPCVALVLGGLWGMLAERSRSLWLPFTCHVLWDLGLFVFVPLVPM